jgi:hypothetical protein
MEASTFHRNVNEFQPDYMASHTSGEFFSHHDENFKSHIKEIIPGILTYFICIRSKVIFFGIMLKSHLSINLVII